MSQLAGNVPMTRIQVGTWELVLPALKLRPRLFQMLYTAEKGPCRIGFEVDAD